MAIEIKQLTPELAEVYTDFLSNLAFEHAPHWATCYCRFYHTNCNMADWSARSGEENKREAQAEIASGRMTGYLAFDGERCIGWVNANRGETYHRLADQMAPLLNQYALGCMICYVIHPEYRRQGVSRALTAHAIDSFREQGLQAVLALPIEADGDPEKLYRGSKTMFEGFGFKTLEQVGALSVMLLEL